MKNVFCFLIPAILISGSINGQIKVQGDRRIAILTDQAINHVQIGPYASPSSLCTSMGAEFRMCRYNSSNWWAYVQGRDGSGTNHIGLVFRSQYNGTLKNAMQIEPNGTVKVLINFVQPSDIRLKTSIREISENEISALYDLNTINYVPMEHDSITPTEPQTRSKFGLIAQEVREKFPDLVFEDSEGYLSISYNDFIPILLEAIKEQEKRINELESMLLELKSDKEQIEIKPDPEQVMIPEKLEDHLILERTILSQHDSFSSDE